MFKKLLTQLTGDGFKARAVRSTALTIFNIGGNNFLRLASNLILTRLLFPEAFGLMALVQVVMAGTAMFSDFGFRGAIVQSPRGEDPVFLNTAWVLQIARGTLLMVVVMALSGPAAAFYEEPQLAGLLIITAVVPFIRGFDSTRFMLADRTLQIERVTIIRLSTQLAGSVVMIVLALWLKSVWALAIGNLVAPLLSVWLSHTALKGPPNRFQVEREALRSLFNYGVFIFLASMAGFLVNHGDRAVLGKFVELDDLAIYNIAMMLASVPPQFSNAISSRVIFPLYARRPPADSVKNRRNINKARFLVTAPLMFVSAVFAVIGDALVRVLYDVRYEAAGPYLVLIALALLPQMIVQSYARLPLASGHSRRYAIFQIVTAIVRFGLLLLMVPSFGLAGAIIVVPLATLILYPVMLIVIRPYKAWDPVHDALFFCVSILLAAGVFWVNGDILAPILEPLTSIYTQ